MPDVRSFFRHCPSCGRRFEVRLVKKEELGSADLAGRLPGRATVPASIAVRAVPTVLQVDRPTVVDIDEFQYTYKCKHCGHQWSEVREDVQSLGELKGYTGD